MNDIDIKALLQSVIDGQQDVTQALSQLSLKTDFDKAVDLSRAEVSPAYDRGDSDLGDAWAKLVMMIKQHAITHLDAHDKMDFIADTIGK